MFGRKCVMIKAEDIVAQFPLSKAGKQIFLEDVKQYAAYLGYVPRIESGRMVIGNPTKAGCILSCGTAASGVAAWLEILRTFPENRRHKVCFLLFDGGSSYYRKNWLHRDKQLLIHLDHVGDGHHLRIYPTKQLRSDRILLTSFYRVCGYFGCRDLLVEEGRKPLLLKTYGGFPNAVTICSLQSCKKRFRYPYKTKYTGIDETNVNILRAALTTYLCCSEVN